MPKAFCAGIWGIIFLFPLFSRAEFYSFEGNNESSWTDPADLISQAAKSAYDLLSWSTHNGDRPVASEKYNRLKHFGTWVDDPRTEECYDTRALVLIRDSKTQVKFSTGNPCKIYSGEWNDPYSGSTFKMARDMEIDHVVALKNAYDSGAFNWDYQYRCLYANFLGYENHLLSASSAENNAKSDHGPEDWMPSDSEYACQHLQNWLVIKFTWKLNMSQAEATAIENEIEQNHCDIKSFQVSKTEMGKIRKYAQQNLELCSQH